MSQIVRGGEGTEPIVPSELTNTPPPLNHKIATDDARSKSAYEILSERTRIQGKAPDARSIEELQQINNAKGVTRALYTTKKVAEVIVKTMKTAPRLFSG